MSGSMSIGFILYFLAPKSAYRRAASPQLKVHFPEKSAQVWESTITWQSRLKSSRPRYSASLNIIMRYMEWSYALYNALLEQGIEKSNACKLVETVGMNLYRPIPNAMYKLSRLRSAKRENRVKLILGLLTRYFFSSPFQYRHLPSETSVEFDITVCPLANYFKDQGVPELTKHAACNLDHALADACGVDLVRSQTIAEGSEHCDFRWKFPPNYERPQKAEQA